MKIDIFVFFLMAYIFAYWALLCDSVKIHTTVHQTFIIEKITNTFKNIQHNNIRIKRLNPFSDIDKIWFTH